MYQVMVYSIENIRDRHMEYVEKEQINNFYVGEGYAYKIICELPEGCVIPVC